MNNSLLVSPYGGQLVDLVVPDEQREELRARANTLTSIQLSERSVCDLELLACGAFSPLDRFVGKEQYQRILDEMRLLDGHIFPIPITLPVNASDGLRLDHEVALRNSKNDILGILTVEEIYERDVAEESHKVFGTGSSHPTWFCYFRWKGRGHCRRLIRTRARVLNLISF